MDVIKIFYDLETTGVNKMKHCIHQIAGLIEINDEVVEGFNIKSAPHPRAKIEPEALEVGGVTEKQIKAYPLQDVSFRKFKAILAKYIDPYNTKQKAYLVGYNNRAFDDLFLRMWFELNGDSYIGSWFWNDTLDVLVLASQYLIDRRVGMGNFKLQTVAKELGLIVYGGKLHDAFYDVELTRGIYRIITGLEIEL